MHTVRGPIEQQNSFKNCRCASDIGHGMHGDLLLLLLLLPAVGCYIEGGGSRRFLEGFHNKKLMSSHLIDCLFYVRRELGEISSHTMLKVAPMRANYVFIMKTIKFSAWQPTILRPGGLRAVPALNGPAAGRQ